MWSRELLDWADIAAVAHVSRESGLLVAYIVNCDPSRCSGVASAIRYGAEMAEREMAGRDKRIAELESYGLTDNEVKQLAGIVHDCVIHDTGREYIEASIRSFVNGCGRVNRSRLADAQERITELEPLAAAYREIGKARSECVRHPGVTALEHDIESLLYRAAVKAGKQ